jgi:hypothetical protein
VLKQSKVGSFAIRLTLVVYILINAVALFSISTPATDSQKHSLASKSISGSISLLISEEKEKENEGDEHEAFLGFLSLEVCNMPQAISTKHIPADDFNSHLKASKIYLRHCSLQI